MNAVGAALEVYVYPRARQEREPRSARSRILDVFTEGTDCW
jgi:hypothetical protein